jgi:Na+/proline symporter
MIILEGIMNQTTQKTILWTPRVLAILFILFLSLFALDVFGAGYGVGELLIALFMHLIPSLALVVVLILAWRWEWVGALAFLGFAAWYLLTAHGQHWSAYALVAGIPALVGLLFLTAWIVKRQASNS